VISKKFKASNDGYCRLCLVQLISWNFWAERQSFCQR
jgi:hypothetical protein